MKQFTVTEPVELKPDPDPTSQSVGALTPGVLFPEPVRLGDWAKVKATDKDGVVQIGWLQGKFLKEIVGQTVELHPEPLSETFEIVTGTIEQVIELANWRKVKVTVGTVVRSGWIDINRLAVVAPGGDTDPVEVGTGEQLDLGANEVYRAALMKAQEITGIDASALAALIDAEASRINSGPEKGQWNRRAFNNASGAAGLTQFLASTWRDHARDSDHLLNKVAKKAGIVTALDAVASGRDGELMELRFDPELSIVSAAEYGIANLKTLDNKGLLPDNIGDDEKARFMYLAHHEGVTGAINFLKRQNSASFDKFVKQVGAEKATQLTHAAGGDVALAYRNWLNGYMDDKIQPAKFRKAGTGPVIVSPGTKTLEKFDGAPIALALFGGQGALVREAQEALSRHGYLDPPADGKWGRISNWALGEFCKVNNLDAAAGFTKDVARALLSPTKTLPDIRPRNDWFDKVVAYMNRKGYWICRYPGCPNIVYLEGVDPDGKVNDDLPNVFNDLRVLFTIDPNGNAVTRVWEATSEPGRHWTINPMNPGGAARIAFDQYKAWVVGTHLKGRASAHEALVQVEPVTVHRDLNRDFNRTNDKTDTGLFGINQHWGYDAPKEDLGNTSAGCLVGRTKSGHREFMAALKADPRFVANSAYRFMAAVLPGDEVMA
jgi:hypothetical protein